MTIDKTQGAVVFALALVGGLQIACGAAEEPGSANSDGTMIVMMTDTDGTVTVPNPDESMATVPVGSAPSPAAGDATPTPDGSAPVPEGTVPAPSPTVIPMDPGPGTPPTDLPGIVLGSDPDGDGVTEPSCVALCESTETDPDGDGDDWFYENGASCVLPGSSTATTARSCVTGQPIPAAEPLSGPGVVVGQECYRLCTGEDPDMDDDYGWEMDASCVFPGSPTATMNALCTVGEEVPTITTVGLPGRQLDGECQPFCLEPNSDEAGEPAGDGWGWEYNTYVCIVEGSAPAQMGLACVVGEGMDLTAPPLNPSPPPGAATRPEQSTSSGFFVTGGQLYDAYGNPFVMRGLNNAHIWFDPDNRYLAYGALDDIAALGTNTVRIVWETTGEAELLRQVVARVVELEMIPMVELHDVTGGTSNSDLAAMAAYYAQADVKAVLVDFEGYLLVNIANEWSGADFAGGYAAAISQLRNAGILHTLVIDASGYGQDSASIFNNGSLLLMGDPQQNLLFSVHMYGNYSSTTTITQTLEQAASSDLAVIVGEFGNQQGNVDAGHVMSECERLGLGYLAWSWKGNESDLAYLDLSSDWEGAQLTSWGQEVFAGQNGITSTATKASIYTQ